MFDDEDVTTAYRANDKRAAALAWAARGFPVFRLVPGGKTPAFKGWQDEATTDPAAIHALFSDPLTGSPLDYNVGCRPVAGQFVVVDLDAKHGVDGAANYQALGGVVGGLVVATPGNGLHLYLSGPDLKNSIGELAAGVDTRGSSGFVVAPGSTIGEGPDAKPYELISDEPMLALPHFVVDALPPKLERTTATTGPLIDGDAPADIKRAIEAAQRHPAACGGMWHTLGFQLGCELARIGLTLDSAIEVAEAHWVSRGTDYKSRDQFVADLSGGFDTATRDGEHGRDSFAAAMQVFRDLAVVPAPADPVAPALSVNMAPPPTRIRGLTPSECGLVKPAPYLIKGLLARGQVGLVAALPAQGKSCFVPLLAYRLARGEAAFGRRTRQGRVAYFGLEDEGGMIGRIEAHRLRFGDAPDFRLFVGVGNLLTSDADRTEIVRLVRADRPALVVLDTVRAGWRGLSENDADAMGAVVAFARELARGADNAPGPAVVLVHHTTKAGGQTASGSGVLEADVDVSLFLSKDPETNVVTVTMGKNRNGEAFGQEMCFEFESVCIGTDEDGDPITRPVAIEVDPRTVRRDKDLSGTQARALAILEALAADVVPAPDMGFGGVFFGGARSVPRAVWETACEVQGLSTAAKPADRARAFRRVLSDLVRLKVVSQLGENVYLMNQGSK